jgi:hypothetical protein
LPSKVKQRISGFSVDDECHKVLVGRALSPFTSFLFYKRPSDPAPPAGGLFLAESAAAVDKTAKAGGGRVADK